jgi:hypothetical protein
VFGKLTVTHLKKKLTAFFCSSTFALNPAMGFHIGPFEAVDILTLIFKIHFNIIFLVLLAGHKSSLLLWLYGFSSCGRWLYVFGCVLPLTLHQKKQPQARRPDLSCTVSISIYLLFLCLYKPYYLGTFSLSFLQFALSAGRCTGNCGFYLTVCVFVETTVNQTSSFYTPLRFRSFSIAT